MKNWIIVSNKKKIMFKVAKQMKKEKKRYNWSKVHIKEEEISIENKGRRDTWEVEMLL